MKDLRKNVRRVFGFWIVFSIGVWLSWNVFGYYENMGSMPSSYWVFGIVGLTMLVIGYYNSFINLEIIASECKRRIES